MSDGTYSSGTLLGALGASGMYEDTAALFDNSDGVAVPHGNEYSLNGFTIEFWVRLDSYGNSANYRPLVRKGDASGDRNYAVLLAAGTQGRLVFSVGAGSGVIDEIGAAELQLDEWHHIVFAHPADGPLTLYVDGQVDKSTTYNVTPATGNSAVEIGNDYVGGSASPAARLDEVAIYSRALTAPEVARHFEAGTFPGP